MHSHYSLPIVTGMEGLAVALSLPLGESNDDRTPVARPHAGTLLIHHANFQLAGLNCFADREPRKKERIAEAKPSRRIVTP